MNGRTRRPLDARSAAEAAFKAMTTKGPAAPAATPRPLAPAAKEPLAPGAREPLTLGAREPRAPGAQELQLPGVKEQVSLRLDQDVLDHFRAGGPGWQDRINTALRKAAGK